MSHIIDITTNSDDNADGLILYTFFGCGVSGSYKLNKSILIRTLIYKIFIENNLGEYGFTVDTWYLQSQYTQHTFRYFDKKSINHYNINFEDEEEEELFLNLKNSNYPSIPLRNEKFNKWLNNKESTSNDVPAKISYPKALHARQYSFVSGVERLYQSIQWFDLEVAHKLIESGLFDLNKHHFYGSYLNILCSGLFPSNCSFNDDYYHDKYLILLEKLLKIESVDIELIDPFGRSSLATAVHHQHKEFCYLLLKYGASINKSVLNEISEKPAETQWFFVILHEVIKEYTDSLKSANLPNIILVMIVSYILDIKHNKNKTNKNNQAVNIRTKRTFDELDDKEKNEYNKPPKKKQKL